MTRTILATCLIFALFACAHRDAGKGLPKLSGRNEPGTAPDARRDSTFYIGYVDYFPETHEFYTALFYRDGREYPDEDLLQAKLDSVILVDDDWGRERLPLQDARDLLVMSGLDTLAIFDRQHRPIGISRLARVEYLWNGMESYFIAVYPADKAFTGQTGELYGITASRASLMDASFSCKEYSDPLLDDYLLRAMKFTKNHPWEMRHYRTSPAESTYSIISRYTAATNEGSSYLTLLENNRAQVLNEEVNNYHFLNILPLPIYLRDKPLLLMTCGYPGSDVLWDFLAAYDGTQYQAVDYNRVHIRQLHPSPANAKMLP